MYSLETVNQGVWETIVEGVAVVKMRGDRELANRIAELVSRIERICPSCLI